MINYLSSFKQEAPCKGREVLGVYVAFVVLKGLALGVQAPHRKQINGEKFLTPKKVTIPFVRVAKAPIVFEGSCTLKRQLNSYIPKGSKY